MKVIVRFLIVAFVAFSGCGGGTIGTGINSLSIASRASSGIPFELQATVVSSAGSAIPGASVTVYGRDGIVYRKTNHQGVAILPLTIESGEQLRFVVESSGDRYEVEDYLSPAGETSVSRTLRLTPAGAIEIGE